MFFLEVSFNKFSLSRIVSFKLFVYLKFSFTLIKISSAKKIDDKPFKMSFSSYASEMKKCL